MDRYQEYNENKRIRIQQYMSIYLLGFLFIITFLFGFHGYYSFPSMNTSSALYSTIRLFLFNFDIPDGSGIAPPITLEIAKWTGVAATNLLVFQLLFKTFSDFMKRHYTTFFGKHTIIIGLNQYSYLLAIDLIKKKQNVIMVAEEDEKSSLKMKLTNNGAVVVSGDPLNYTILQKVRLTRCRTVVLFTFNDDFNMELLYRISILLHKEKRIADLEKNCSIHVHLNDIHMKFLFDRDVTEVEELHSFNQNGQVHFFNLYEIKARKLFHDYPLFSQDLKNEGEGKLPTYKPHILVIGFNDLAKKIVLQAAKIAYYPSGEKLKITIVDRHTKNNATNLRLQYPNIDKVCEVHFIDWNLREASYENATGELHDVTYCVTCMRNKEFDYVNGLQLIKQLNIQEIYIYKPEYFYTSVTHFLKDLRGISHIKEFGNMNDIATEDVIIKQKLDEVAKWSYRIQTRTINNKGNIRVASHSRFDRRKIRWGQKIRTVNNSDRKELTPGVWEHLTHEYKAATISKGDFYPIILHLLHLKAVPMDDISPSHSIVTRGLYREICREQLDLLAKLLHAQWKAVHHLNGWVGASTALLNSQVSNASKGKRDTIKAKSFSNSPDPALVRWDKLNKLSEITGIQYKESYRNEVLAIVDVYDLAGYELVERYES
ncbi:NAD-binding protein [Evansella tamaricis]|uniref:NAD-binding protein n=1 Tax=Evansella tamaricis TaxID=2069301 RepID=A0ABS6JGA4_9BACI|nr:NAD-binding protein [Evansella tamaricis]MBU9712678.1 NAD-binding protein [Evansella tamaricis]